MKPQHRNTINPHQFSGSFITDADGSAVQHLQYLPFGETFVNQTSTSWATPYTFSDKEKDSETGYSYFGARYYDSGMSVWLSVDPLGDKYPSMSPFMYTAGNPVMLVDPDGKRIWVFTKNGQKLKYKDNKLYQRNGLFKWKEYEGDDKDATDILDHLNHLKNNEDKEVSGAVDFLENSFFNVKIRITNEHTNGKTIPGKAKIIIEIVKNNGRKLQVWE